MYAQLREKVPVKFSLLRAIGAVPFLIVLLLWPLSLWAHGAGRPHVTDVAIGPYQMTVWVSPDPPRTGDLRFGIVLDQKTIAPQSGENQTILASTEPTLQIKLKSIAQGTELATQLADRQTSFFQTYYESYFTVPSLGQWQVTVLLTDGTGTTSADFLLEVLPPTQINWLLVVSIFVLTMGLIVSVGWWNRRYPYRVE